MGKRKICATHLLHEAGATKKRKLEHASRIDVTTKQILLAKVGKSSEHFEGKICFDCIATVKGNEDNKLLSQELKLNISNSVNSEEIEQGYIHTGLDNSVDFDGSYDEGTDDMSDNKCHQTSESNINSCGLHDEGTLGMLDHDFPQPFHAINVHADESGQGMEKCAVQHEPSVTNNNQSDTTSGVLLCVQNAKEDLSSLSAEIKALVASQLSTGPVVVLSLNNIREDLRSLSPEIRALLAHELAVVERPNIRKDTLNLSKKECRDLDTLSNLCDSDYLKSRNNVLVQFLTGLLSQTDTPRVLHHPTSADDTSTAQPTCSGYQPFPIQKPSDIYKIAKVTEACMGLTMQINVLPFHFREIVLLYSHTRSRAALTLMSSTAPHGSYQTVRAWLDALADSDSGTQLPGENGDYVCTFDNNQVLQRRWNISVENRSVCTVITMVMFMKIDSEGTLQFQEELKPCHWMWNGLDERKLTALKKGHHNVVHKQTRYQKHYHPWLTGIIQEVALEQKITPRKCMDDVDEKVAAKQYARQFKSCTGCGNTNIDKGRRKCPFCKKDLPSIQKERSIKNAEKTGQNSKSQKGEIRATVSKHGDAKYGIKYERSSQRKTEYDHLQQHHPEHPPEVIIGEPIFLNPCSYEAVAQVFRNIGKQAGIRRYGGTREWLAIVCDGLPYVIGYQIIERTRVCQLCGVSVSGYSECASHKEDHPFGCTFIQEFDWLLLQPGPGHIEMNMLKSFVKFSWPVFWESMVEVFNWTSDTAKRSAKNVSDHHKGMTLARIARESFAKELVLPYVRHQILHDGELSVASFHKFTMDHVKSPSYALMCDLTFVILDSIFLYRAGLRSGDVQMMNSGRAFFSRMWCARNHPMYRQLVAYDNIMAACMPPQLLEFINKTKSINLSGEDYTGEGIDFRLEEINRLIQHWLSSAPTEKDWINACANQPKLAKLREQALKDMNIKDPKGYSHCRQDIEKEVLAFRTAIRDSQFILNPAEDGPLLSLKLDPLDGDLANFAQKAAQKESIFMENFIQHKKDGGMEKKKQVPFDEPPIFVAPEERAEYNYIGNKNVTEIISLTHIKISMIEDNEMRDYFAAAFRSEVLKNSNKSIKQDYVDFFHLLEEFEDCAGNFDVQLGSDDETYN